MESTLRLARLSLAAVTLAVTTTTTLNAQQRATYEVVSSFDLPSTGGREPSSLRLDSDGTFYGTTSRGGMFDWGVLFRMNAAGVVTSLHSFSEAEGAEPFGLVRASNGRFYGFTRQGGEFGRGTVFMFTPGSPPTTVHAFSTQADHTPVDLFAASDGNVYGLASDGGGGAFDNGTIFVIDPNGTFSTILSIPVSAAMRASSLIRAVDGRFYVTAEQAPVAPGGFGTVFTIDDAGTVTTIHNFNGEDGAGPIGLMQRSDGVVFGTATRGLAEIVYAIDTNGNYREVHRFNPGGLLGLDLVEASDGNVYGFGNAGLFRIDSSDTLTPLPNGSGPDPVDLTLGSDERLYGPTELGEDGLNTIITIDLAGTRTTIYEFGIGGSPGRPNGVIQTRDGGFYGTTSLPGSAPTGTVFAMDAAGTRTTLHTFVSNLPLRNDGSPNGHLFEGADGSLYGTTFVPFCDNFLPAGQIFSISPGGLFTRLAGATNLLAGVIQARDGNLYGTSVGAYNVCHPQFPTLGRVFTTGARGTLHTFAIDENPVGELVEIDDGSLYGATAGGTVPVSGTIFQVNPATGAFTTRHSFTDGTRPAGRLIQGTDGLLYGTTVNGGALGVGTVFSFDAAGTLTTLHNFAGPDGANPGPVIQGFDGRLYGTTGNGGAFGYGTLFVMNVTGGLTTLHDFALSDGADPGHLFQANDGAFYGTASSGGPTGGGVIFRVRLDTSPADAYYELVSRNSGKCLDVYGASTVAVASVIQWVCHGGENQQWRLEPAGGGAFRIVARHSGQALDVFGALLDDVTPIIQYPAHGGDNQAWTLEPASDGYVIIVARHSGKAMDVEFASTDDGARVIQYTIHGAANQQWLLRAAPSAASPVTP